jgi:hypothetical protein
MNELIAAFASNYHAGATFGDLASESERREDAIGAYESVLAIRRAIVNKFSGSSSDLISFLDQEGMKSEEEISKVIEQLKMEVLALNNHTEKKAAVVAVALRKKSAIGRGSSRGELASSTSSSGGKKSIIGGVFIHSGDAGRTGRNGTYATSSLRGVRRKTAVRKEGGFVVDGKGKQQQKKKNGATATTNFTRRNINTAGSSGDFTSRSSYRAEEDDEDDENGFQQMMEIDDEEEIEDEGDCRKWGDACIVGEVKYPAIWNEEQAKEFWDSVTVPRVK